MAFFDTTLLLSNAQSLSATAASTNLYDVTGAGSGVAPLMVTGTNTTTYGADIGNGDGMAIPTAVFYITTTGTGTGTYTFEVQAALNNANSPGTWVTLSSSAAYVGTTLIAGNEIVLPIPPFAQIAPGEGLPRFYRLHYTLSGSAAVSVTGYIGLNPTTGYVSTQIANNFTAV